MPARIPEVMAREVKKDNCHWIKFLDHGFGEIPPLGTIGPARWDWFDLLCVHRGVVELQIAHTGSLQIKSGQGALIHPDTSFAGRALADGARISIQHFALTDGKAAQPLPFPLAALHPHRQGADIISFRCAHLLDADVDRAIAFAFDPPSDALHDLRVAQLVLILGQIKPVGDVLAATCQDPRVADLQRQVQDSDPGKLTPGTMADWVGLSPSRFRSWFREYFRMSPKQFLMRRRVNQAMRLLRETSRPIKAISDELSYPDLPAFYRDFRRITATTPASYRSLHTVHA